MKASNLSLAWLICACCSRVGFRLLLSLAHWSVLLMIKNIGSFLAAKEDWRRREEYFLGAYLEAVKVLRMDQRGEGSRLAHLWRVSDIHDIQQVVKREKEKPTWIERFGLARYDISGYETDIERETAEILWFGMTSCRWSGCGRDTHRNSIVWFGMLQSIVC